MLGKILFNPKFMVSIFLSDVQRCIYRCNESSVAGVYTDVRSSVAALVNKEWSFVSFKYEKD